MPEDGESAMTAAAQKLAASIRASIESNGGRVVRIRIGPRHCAVGYLNRYDEQQNMTVPRPGSNGGKLAVEE